MKKLKLSYFIFGLGLISALFTFGLLYLLIFRLVMNFYKEQNYHSMKILAENSFNSMYSIMSKGWTREELKDFLNYLNNLNQNSNTKTYIHRSDIVNRQFGNLEDIFKLNQELEAIINESYQSKEKIERIVDKKFYYVKPLLVEEKCQQCHQANKEDILGLVLIQKDISVETQAIERKLNQIFFIFVLIPITGSLILSYILVYYIRNGIQKLEDYSKTIQSISDLKQNHLNKINFPFYEFNSLKNQFKKILNKIQKISIDKEILTTEMKILEKFIITTEAIKDWIDYIKKILANIHSFIHFYFFYSVFKESQKIILVYIFHRFDEEVNYKSFLQKKIIDQIQASEIYQEDLQIQFIFENLPNVEQLKVVSLEEIETITKSIFIDKPLIGGIVGVGIDLSQKEDEVKKLAFESLLATMVNIVGSIKAINLYTKELEYYATRDPLTELYNQRVFWDLLNYEVERAKRHNYQFAVVVIDLDNFKMINDSFGHEIGDQILKSIANLLRKTFRKEDILARYGGDEFVAILPYVNEVYVQTIMERFYEHLREFHYNFNGNIIQVFASTGISIFPFHAQSAKDLFIVADETMFKAKDEGKNRFKITIHSNFQVIEEREKEINKILISLVQNKNIIPNFQPIYFNDGKSIYGYEVLMRIKEKSEIISAGHFIHLAEKMGIIFELDLILFEQVLKEYHNTSYKFFFNLSPKSLLVPEYLQKIKEIIIRYNSKNIVFEITEREAIKDIESIREFILNLKKFGVEFAIDDFGSGFSSYLYIKEIPLDYIKIEGNFIRTMLTNEVDKVFIESIIKMSKILKIKTIAEFVENQFIFDAIKTTDVDFLQGNYLGQPQLSIEL